MPSAVQVVSGLGDRHRHQGHLRRREVLRPGSGIVTVVRCADAGDHLEPVALGAALHQRVETVLCLQQLRGPGTTTGEGGDPPRLRVRGVLRVPGLVRPMERTQSEVHGTDRPGLTGRRPALAVQPGQKRTTSRGSRWARSAAVATTSSSSSRCSAAAAGT